MLRDNKLSIDRISPITRLAIVGVVLLCGLFVAGLRGPGVSGIALADEKEKPAVNTDVENAAKKRKATHRPLSKQSCLAGSLLSYLVLQKIHQKIRLGGDRTDHR